jgi:hypothetical protein
VLRGWRRRAAIALAAVALYAFLGFFVVPWIARPQLEKYGLRYLHRETRVERVEFNPFTFVAEISGLDMKDRDGAGLFAFDRARLDFEVSGVFRRAWKFADVEVDGLRATGRILPDGNPSVADLLVPSEPPPPEARSKHFPRLIVDHLVLRRGRADFVDETRSPRFEETLAPLDVDVHDLTTIPRESGEHVLTVGIGNKTRIHWTGNQTVDPFRLRGKFEITGVFLPRAWEYTSPLPALLVREGTADLQWSYELGPGPDGATNLTLAEGSVKVRDLAVRPREGPEDWLTVPSVEAVSIHLTWPASQVEVGEVRIHGAKAVVLLEPDRTVNWQRALATPPAPAPSRPWTWKVGAVEVTDGAAHLEDRSVKPAVAVEVHGAAARFEGLSNDLTAPVKTHATAQIQDEGEATLDGTITPDPFAAALDVAAEGIDIVPFRSYFAVPNADLVRGTGGAAGKVLVGSGSPKVRFDGMASLDGIEVVDLAPSPLVNCEKVRAKGIRLTVAPDRLRIADLVLERGFAKIIIDREGVLNLSRVGLTQPAPGVGAPGGPPPPLAPPLDITMVKIRDAKVDFTDETLVLPFRTEIHSANGSVKDLSNVSAAPARLDAEGRVAEEGYVKAVGTLRVADPFASSDVTVTFRDVNMPKLTPYFATFAGYEVKDGSLDLDLRYRVVDRHLVGDHKVVAKKLVLGEKVESPDAPHLPVRLAVALLKDKDGNIDLEVPIEGTVDSPEFNYRKVFWQAVRKILFNVAAAPFRALGRLFGSDKEDLDLVEFAAGRSDLLPPEQETLAKLATELAARPELSIEAAGRFDPVADPEAIRRARVEQRIEEKRATVESPEAILEALYAESFTPERLEAERAKFQPQAAPTPEPETTKKKKKKKKKEAAPPPPPKGTFDAAGFYDALRAQLLAAEPVDDAMLEELARARGAAIATALTTPGGLDPSRVKVVDPAPVKRKKRGSDLVASEMTLSAGD